MPLGRQVTDIFHHLLFQTIRSGIALASVLSNSLDQDRKTSVGPGMVQNCLQRLSTDDKIAA